jgi:hypothetical protein
MILVFTLGQYSISSIRMDRYNGTVAVGKMMPAPNCLDSGGCESFLISNSLNNSVPIFVSFIIPTMMRGTLYRTAVSLKNQTRDNWEAIMGIEMARGIKIDHFPKQFHDERFRYMLVATAFKSPSSPGKNGAGEIRNAIIASAARGEWVAFVDDDDTLSPHYVEWLEDSVMNEEKRGNKRVDVVLFRMKIGVRKEMSKDTILPPFRHGNRALNSWVGISFAVRRDLFSSNTVAFQTPSEPHMAEDYYFLKTAFKIGLNMQIADCVAYFVREDPKVQPGSCNLSRLTVV